MDSNHPFQIVQETKDLVMFEVPNDTPSGAMKIIQSIIDAGYTPIASALWMPVVICRKPQSE